MLADQIKAIVVHEAEPGRLVVRDIISAEARAGEITVRVTAISLDRGETKSALTTE